MKYLYRCIPFLIFLLFCGCSYNDYTKTVLLPAQNPNSSAEKESSAGDWELKKMYQYQYTSTNTAGWDEGLHTSVGWSGDDHTLYTLHGGSQEQVTVNKVDIRYGFYEECANLGVLNYNHMELSPDGKYVLYDTNENETNSIKLCLYSIADQTTITIADLPAFESFFSLRFVWSKDSTCFYYWYTMDSKLIEIISKEFDSDNLNKEELTAYYYDLYEMADESESLLKIQEYDLVSGQVSCIYYAPFYALERDVFPSSDGSKVLIKTAPNWDVLVYDRATGNIKEIPENIFYEYGISPEEFAHYGLTSSTVYTRSSTYPSIMFFTEEKDSYTASDYMATAAYTSRKLSGTKFLVSNDEKHMVDVETNDNGESLILVYNYTPNISGKSTLSGGQLLYQTTDPITSISLTPDDRYIILLTEQELVTDTFYNTADAAAKAGADEETDMKEAAVSPPSYQYKITVLEL